MITLSRTAFAAALLVAGVAVAPVTPAEAKKNRAPAETFALSDDVRAAATAAKTALTAHDPVGAQSAIVRIESGARNDDERYVGAQLRVQLEFAKADAAPGTPRSDVPLAAALDFLINYPRTPKAALPGYVATRANIFYRSRQFDRAAVYYRRARDLGYKVTDLDILGRAEMESGDLPGGANDFEMAINAQAADGKKAPEAWYRFVIARFYHANKPAESAAWTAKWLRAYPDRSNWHEAVVAFGFQGEGLKRLSDAQRLDLYRLLRAAKSLGGQIDYSDYAASATKLGLPAEAKSVIEEGRSSGAIPPKDPDTTRLLTTITAAIKAKPLAAQEKTATTGEQLAAVADGYLGQRNLTKAIAFYDAALAKSVANADDVNLHRAIAIAMAGEKARAIAALAAVTSAPDTEIALLWKTWVEAD